MAGQRVAGAQAADTPQAAAAREAQAAQARAAGKTAGRATRGAARGVGGFLRPFRRVGGILWLEVTGVFFLLFVIGFARFAWSTRQSYAHGPDHLRFLVYTAAGLVFLYLGISSFWRAGRK